MGPQEEGVTQTATPLGIAGRGIPRISEKPLLAVYQSRTNDLGETHMQVEKAIPETGITRIRGKSSAPRLGQEGSSVASNNRYGRSSAIFTECNSNGHGV